MKALAISALLLVAGGSAYAYETGDLTCERIGELAAETLAAKQSGISDSACLTELSAPFAADAAVERHLVANIVTVIYRNDLLVAMKPRDAQMVFMRDCLLGKEQDRRR